MARVAAFISGLALCLIVLAATPPPARAEFPFSLRVSGGLGQGGGQSDGATAVGPFGIAAVDFAWRHRPGRAIVLSLETAGGPFSVSHPASLTPRYLDSIDHTSLVLGIERSLPDTPSGPYVQFGAGIGRVVTDAFQRSNGVALSGAAGARIVPSPGPVGFLFGLRTNHVFSAHARCHALAVTLGLTIHPR